MKKTFLVLGVLTLAVMLLASNYTVTIGQSGFFPTVIARKVIAIDSLRSQGKATFNNFVAGTTKIRGSATFEAAAAVDTVNITGVTSGSIVILTPKYAAGDTAKSPILWASPTTDKFYVFRSGTSSAGGFSYNYLVVK